MFMLIFSNIKVQQLQPNAIQEQATSTNFPVLFLKEKQLDQGNGVKPGYNTENKTKP